MKPVIFIFVFMVSRSLAAYAQDLPGPAPDLRTLPSGSYVIAMDNTHQQNSSGYFNMKAYGCIVHLLNQYVSVKRVILTGKVKDSTDFSVDATQVKPTLGTGSVKNFKAGPFVVFRSDTTGVANLVQGFNNQQTSANLVRLYRTNADVIVDVRHDLSGFVPKAAILNDGGNEGIHQAYLTWAGVTTQNYAINAGINLVSLCFTFASEPHNGFTNPTVDSTIERIKNFVQQGCNFLAQCEAIVNYENNPLGRFQTTNGITVVNKALAATDSFPNADLAFNQFEGVFTAQQGGSVRTWKLAAGSAPANNMYPTCNGSTKDDTLGASVSKLVGGVGGMVFYLGNHDYSTATSYDDINGVRMYMNAFLTPVTFNNTCTINAPLYLQFKSFDAYRDGPGVKLVWETTAENNNRGFQVERKTGNGEFQPVAFIPSRAINVNSSELQHYEYSDNVLLTGTIQYRIRQIDLNGISRFSSVKTIAGMDPAGRKNVIVYPNPSYNGKVGISFEGMNAAVNISIADFSGRVIRHWDGFSGKYLQVENLTPGYYILSALNIKTGEKTVGGFLVAGH